MTDGLTPRQRAMRDATARKPETREPGAPRYGPWVEGESGWTVCETHDEGIQPGTSCLSCRLAAMDIEQFPI